MKFAPKKESELNNFENLPPGEYPFTVIESDIAISKSQKNTGKEMVKVKLNVHGPVDRHIYDYFADWFSEWKLKHFCETAGLGAQYLAGNVSPEQNAWRDRTGYVKIGVEKGSGNFGDKNIVIDYLPDDEQKVDADQGQVPVKQSAKPVATDKTSPHNDDVPF